MNNYLNEATQKILRKHGVINEHEVVEKQGDLYVAVNVITGTRRTITVDQAVLNESGKRVLRG